ncbi:hypothetical protein GCM10009647_035870 [Streptomyces sanglieri]
MPQSAAGQIDAGRVDKHAKAPGGLVILVVNPSTRSFLLARRRGCQPNHPSGWKRFRVPFRGRILLGWRRRHNRDHAKIRSVGERAMATLKCWRLLRELRCSTTRITGVVRAVVALELAT